ncbi:helix-turn-helix transcriptional regulator [Chelativorans sp. YIM 93263]|uniref:helix-turn-helix transcriptional regulator n=1 Tax=Chelativorans sp. YIM 93263 TaxID=2906648 RepID=UPI0023794B65|nr:helix-turn-helix domain-containing protein [Chelativorans sp. YIM 93263]
MALYKRIRLEKNHTPKPRRRERVRLTEWDRFLDPAEWKKLDALRPLPLNWKRRPGLMFPLMLRANPESFFLTTKQAAEFLGKSDKTLHNWRAQGIGPKFVKVERRTVHYNVADMLNWLVKLRAKRETQR